MPSNGSRPLGRNLRKLRLERARRRQQGLPERGRILGLIEEGKLVVTEAMIAGAEHDGDCWCIRQTGLEFRFVAAQGRPVFGPDGFFTRNPEAWVDAALLDLLREGLIEAKQRGGKPVYRNGEPVFITTAKGRAYFGGEDAGPLEEPDPG